MLRIVRAPPDRIAPAPAHPRSLRGVYDWVTDVDSSAAMAALKEAEPHLRPIERLLVFLLGFVFMALELGMAVLFIPVVILGGLIPCALLIQQVVWLGVVASLVGFVLAPAPWFLLRKLRALLKSALFSAVAQRALRRAALAGSSSASGTPLGLPLGAPQPMPTDAVTPTTPQAP